MGDIEKLPEMPICPECKKFRMKPFQTAKYPESVFWMCINPECDNVIEKDLLKRDTSKPIARQK